MTSFPVPLPHQLPVAPSSGDHNVSSWFFPVFLNKSGILWKSLDVVVVFLAVDKMTCGCSLQGWRFAGRLVFGSCL